MSVLPTRLRRSLRRSIAGDGLCVRPNALTSNHALLLDFNGGKILLGRHLDASHIGRDLLLRGTLLECANEIEVGALSALALWTLVLHRQHRDEVVGIGRSLRTSKVVSSVSYGVSDVASIRHE